MIPLAALAVVVASMLVELRISHAHERDLCARGAVATIDPPYAVMRWAYPGVFVAMAAEGVLRGAPSSRVVATGVVVFICAKALKAWAIHSLGTRWTYRVLILPGAPLVAEGPYRVLRHPNYVAVIGELLGMALMCGAPVTGPLAVVGFGYLLTRRIAAEERALGLG